MLRNKLAVIGMIIGMIAGSSFGFWVQRTNTPTYSAFEATQGSGSGIVYYGAIEDSNYGVWVDLPDINLSITSFQNNGISNGAHPTGTTSFSSFSDVSSDIEYESRTFRDTNALAMKKNYRADIIKIAGRYEYFPDETQSYGFHFNNQHVDGLDYMNTFNAAGTYKKYWGDQEAGCTFNINFLSGSEGGLIFGPTLHYLYKKYVGSARLVGGAYGSYSYCTMKKFDNLHRNFLSYGLIGACGAPLYKKLDGNLELFGSHEYLVGSIQFPYAVAPNMQLVCGVKKAFVFKEKQLSNFMVTIGASKRF